MSEQAGTPLATLAIAISLLATAGSASLQAAELARTPWGHPDIQGLWNNSTISSLERSPELADKLVVSAEEALELEGSYIYNVLSEQDAAPSDPERPPPSDGDTDAGYNAFWIDPGTHLMVINGEHRTSIITDPPNGRIPYSAAGVGAFMAYGARSGYDGPEQRPLGERCLVGFGSSGGPPMIPVLYNNNYQIVQTPDHVMILVEMNHDARIIRLDGEHLPDVIKPWLGDSVGRWEGDTLVVETINQHPQQAFRFATTHRLYVPTTAKITERFTPTAEGELVYQFTVEDAEAYEVPWSGEVAMRKAEGRMFEYACHEGNYALPGILAGARTQERDAAAAN
ncbi:MAG: hypothetical protein WBJ75_12775 [Pseudohongiellaceae bacterium]